MQNYEQILQEIGIEIPDDKKADLKKKNTLLKKYDIKAN